MVGIPLNVRIKSSKKFLASKLSRVFFSDLPLHSFIVHDQITTQNSPRKWEIRMDREWILSRIGAHIQCESEYVFRAENRLCHIYWCTY